MLYVKLLANAYCLSSNNSVRNYLGFLVALKSICGKKKLTIESNSGCPNQLLGCPNVISGCPGTSGPANFEHWKAIIYSIHSSALAMIFWLRSRAIFIKVPYGNFLEPMRHLRTVTGGLIPYVLKTQWLLGCQWLEPKAKIEDMVPGSWG